MSLALTAAYASLIKSWYCVVMIFLNGYLLFNDGMKVTELLLSFFKGLYFLQPFLHFVRLKHFFMASAVSKIINNWLALVASGVYKHGGFKFQFTVRKIQSCRLTYQTGR